jgi:hypothetical protein
MVLYSPNENRAGLYEGLMIRPFVEFIGDPPVWNPVQKSLNSKVQSLKVFYHPENDE